MKVVSSSLGLVDFAFGLLNSVGNLPDRQVKFLGEFKSQRNCDQSCWSKIVFFFCVGEGDWRLVKMAFWLAHANFNLPERQAAKLNFFAPYSVICSVCLL